MPRVIETIIWAWILAHLVDSAAASDPTVIDELRLPDLFNEMTSDMSLSVLIPKLSKSMSLPAVQDFVRQLRRKDAAILIGRLLRSVSLSTEEVVELLNLLVSDVDRALFSEVLALNQPSPEPIISLPISDGSDIPPALSEVVRAATSPQDHIPFLIQRVQRRFPAPYDSVFPDNDIVAARLLDRPEIFEYLVNPDTMRRLIVYGIQFDLLSFLAKVDLPSHRLNEFVPLLRQDPTIPPSTIIDRLVVRHRYDLAVALIQCPDFNVRIPDDAVSVVDVLLKTLREKKLQLITTAVSQPFAKDIINTRGRYDDDTLLKCALRENDMDALALLLQVSNIDLRSVVSQDEGPASSYSRECLEIVEKVRPELLFGVQLSPPCSNHLRLDSPVDTCEKTITLGKKRRRNPFQSCINISCFIRNRKR